MTWEIVMCATETRIPYCRKKAGCLGDAIPQMGSGDSPLRYHAAIVNLT